MSPGRAATALISPFLFHEGFIEGLVHVEVIAVQVEVITRTLGPIESNSKR